MLSDSIEVKLDYDIYNDMSLIQMKAEAKWAASQENLSSGFPTKRVSNQSPQLQRLASELKFRR